MCTPCCPPTCSRSRASKVAAWPPGDGISAAAAVDADAELPGLPQLSRRPSLCRLLCPGGCRLLSTPCMLNLLSVSSAAAACKASACCNTAPACCASAAALLAMLTAFACSWEAVFRQLGSSCASSNCSSALAVSVRLNSSFSWALAASTVGLKQGAYPLQRKQQQERAFVYTPCNSSCWLLLECCEQFQPKFGASKQPGPAKTAAGSEGDSAWARFMPYHR